MISFMYCFEVLKVFRRVFYVARSVITVSTKAPALVQGRRQREVLWVMLPRIGSSIYTYIYIYIYGEQWPKHVADRICADNL